jgi:hypothetical protein
LQRTGKHDANSPFELVAGKGVVPAKELGFARPPLNTTLARTLLLL